MRLKDKVAVVTGAASGIGKEIAATFAREGAKVAIADLNQAGADATAAELGAAGGKAIGVAMDVTDEGRSTPASAQAVEAFGGIDILVSNAGIQIVASARGVRLRRMEEAAGDPSRRRLPDHARLPARTCTSRARGGSIIYMGSVHSKEASLLKAPYVTAKHGLIGLAKVVAKEGAQAQRARQRDLPRLRAHAAGGQADSRAGQGARHLRSRSRSRTSC